MPTIKKPNQHFDATLYTGNGSTQVIVNQAQFKPDLVWVKTRNAGATDHCLFDAVRGVSKYINSNNTGAEATYTGFGTTAFNSNGFTVVDNAGGGYLVNGSTGSPTYVGWQWKAGGASTVNTSGSISSNVSVNTTAGFSVVTYTGTGSNATVGHGLGVAPKMIIFKKRNATSNWIVWREGFTSLQFLYLNLVGAIDIPGAPMVTSASSTTIGLGTDGDVNGNGATFVAYCWAEIEGYSKFGSYTGNGSADGPFQYTGFRPKFIVVKKTSDVGEWAQYDSVRETFNPNGAGEGRLRLNTSAAAAGADSAQYIDFLSNGFKIRNTSGFNNDSGGTYIYMAFAEAPFKYSSAR